MKPGLLILAVALGASPAFGGHDYGWTVLAITPEIAKRYVDEGVQTVFVDLRSVEAFKKGRLPGARSIPRPELARRTDEIPRAGLVILYCACPPVELHGAYRLLFERGHRNIAVLEGGMVEWTERRYPTEQ